MKCVCGFSGYPAQELSDSGKLVTICPVCGRQELPQAPVESVVVTDTVPVPAAAAQKVPDTDLVVTMRARLAVLDVEILKRRAFEDEAKTLRKMLRVAEREESRARSRKKSGAANGATAKN